MRALTCVLFVIQKVVEIAAIVFVPYWAGCFSLWIKDCTASIIGTWILGVGGIAVLVGIGGLSCMIFFCAVPELCKANWKFAKKLAGKVLPVQP